VANGGVAASDVVRSMKREGFADEEIYDVLTGTGLFGEQVQLLIDRIAAEFEEAKLEPKPSRLGVEVSKMFKAEFEDFKHGLTTRIDSLSHGLGFLKVELEKLGRRVVELQAEITRSRVKAKSPRFT